MTADLRLSVLESEVESLRAELAAVKIAVRGELSGEPEWRSVLRRWERGETMASALDAVVGGLLSAEEMLMHWAWKQGVDGKAYRDTSEQAGGAAAASDAGAGAVTADLRLSVLEDEVGALRAELAALRIAVRGELAGEPQWRSALRRWARGEAMAAALDAVGSRREVDR